MEPEKPKPVEEKKVEPTEVEKKLPAPATAEAVQATAAEPVQAKLMQPAAAVEPACPNKGIQEDPPQQQGGLTRRAAANVLSRVKDSESRLKSEFPSWMHSHIMNPANKSELITLIKESGGELKAVQAKLEITLKEEMVKSNMAKSSMIPLTEVEIIGKYGEAEAAKVMQQKVKDRLTVPDPNRSGGLLYLMQQDTTEYKRGSKQTWGMFGQMEAANVAPSDLEGFMSGYNVGACKIEDGAPAPPATPPRSHEPATTSPSPSPSPAMPAAPAVPSNPPPAAPVATGKAVPSAPAAAAIPEVKEAPLDPPPAGKLGRQNSRGMKRGAPEAPTVMGPKEKATDLASKALDKSNECTALANALTPYSYGTKLAEELHEHSAVFKNIYVETTRKKNETSDLTEADFLPFAKEYVLRSQACASVMEAAKAFTMGSAKAKPRKPKAKPAPRDQ